MYTNEYNFSWNGPLLSIYIRKISWHIGYWSPLRNHWYTRIKLLRVGLLHKLFIFYDTGCVFYRCMYIINVFLIYFCWHIAVKSLLRYHVIIVFGYRYPFCNHQMVFCLWSLFALKIAYYVWQLRQLTIANFMSSIQWRSRIQTIDVRVNI